MMLYRIRDPKSDKYLSAEIVRSATLAIETSM